MEIIKYEIKKGDTLESIAIQQGLPVRELVNFHNENCGLTNMIIGDKVPIQLTFILLEKEKKDINEEDICAARYRCEQINTSKFNGNLVHYVEQNFQYLLKINFQEKTGHVKLEDYKKNMSPALIAETFDFIKATERIKNNVSFKLNSKGKIKEITNKEEINKNWNDFKESTFSDLAFIKKLQEVNPSAVHELKNIGDRQFSLSANNEEEYWRNFFYFCCFDQYLFNNDHWDEMKFDFVSTIVPPIIIPLSIRYDKVDEKDGIITVRKVAEYKLTENLEKEIIKRYDELHKSVVKYNFTAYKLIFRSTIEIDSSNKTLKTGKVVLKEEVSDNIENECTFTIKKLENFTP